MDGYAQFAQPCRACASGIVNACGPGSPDSHRAVWGLTSRPPVSPRGPSSGFPFARRVLPFARRPLVSLRPAFSGSFPSAAARVPVSLPLGNLHDSAAGGRFRRRWSRAARAKVTSPAATTPRLELALIRPAPQIGNGRARGDTATESPVTSGREPRDAAAPEPTRSTVTCAAARRSGSCIPWLASRSWWLAEPLSKPAAGIRCGRWLGAGLARPRSPALTALSRGRVLSGEEDAGENALRRRRWPIAASDSPSSG